MNLKKIKYMLKNMGKTQWITVILVGVLLLVIAIPVSPDSDDSGEKPEEMTEEENVVSVQTDYQEYLEQQLEEILETMDGVGKVRVMITVKDKGEKVVEKDNATSHSSTTSDNGIVSDNYTSDSTTVYDGEDTPYETKELLPEVEGVAVVAEGADDVTVEARIYQTVKALFQVDAHKISVVKMRVQEGT